MTIDKAIIKIVDEVMAGTIGRGMTRTIGGSIIGIGGEKVVKCMISLKDLK